MTVNSTAAGRYSELSAGRQVYLQRARECAKFTIPAIFPPEGFGPSSKLYTPFQSVGARGVNNLASKLLITLFPPNAPFFRLSIDDFTLEALSARPDMRGEMEKALSKIERATQVELEAMAFRISAFHALKLLIVSGNALLVIPADGPARVIRLDHYVVQRDPMGRVLRAIIKDEVAPETLPQELQSLAAQGSGSGKQQKTVAMYTEIERIGDQWLLNQYINDQPIPDAAGLYPLDKPPFLALRWNAADGEDYGRGYVEEFIGDFVSLEGLSQAILEGSAAASKVLFMVKPNSLTKLTEVTKAENGAVISGNAEDVTVLQTNKAGDFRTAAEQAKEIYQRLSLAFLLNSAIQRNGERVTAEEIRFMANELESALGGVYGVMSQEFQLPVAQRVMARMEKKGKLPVLPKDTVQPSVVTGFEALGRGNDLQRLNALVETAAKTLGERFGMYFNANEYISRASAALQVNPEGLFKSEDQVKAEMAQMQQQQLLAQGVGPAINAVGRVAAEGMKQSGTQG